MTSTTTTPPRLAPLDDIGRAIQKVLRTDPPEPGPAGGTAQFAAHGYAAAEAYFYLAALGGLEVQPMRLAADPAPRWFLCDYAGRVIDLTLGRGDRAAARDVPYADAVRRGFRWTRHGPSARARHIIESIEPEATDDIIRLRRRRRA